MYIGSTFLSWSDSVIYIFLRPKNFKQTIKLSESNPFLFYSDFSEFFSLKLYIVLRHLKRHMCTWAISFNFSAYSFTR